MKRKVVGVLAVIAALVLIATVAAPVFAAWLGTMTQKATVNEAITPPKIIEADNQDHKPGETHSSVIELRNTSAEVTYGMGYGSRASYTFNDYGKGKVSTPTLTTIELEPKATSGGSESSVGEITMFVDTDGPGPIQPAPYLPWTKVNIAPSGTHWIGINVKIFEDAYPGTINVDFYHERGKPAPEVSPTPTPIPELPPTQN